MGTCATKSATSNTTAPKESKVRKREKKKDKKALQTSQHHHNHNNKITSTQQGQHHYINNTQLLMSWKTVPLLFDPVSDPLFNGKYNEEAAKEAARLREVTPSYEAAGLTENKIFIRLPGHVNGQRITAYENKKCGILILDHCDSVSIHESENCFIFIGPTSGSVFIERCRNCVIVCCCTQMRLRECRHLQISLFVATMPVIEDSSDIGICSLSGWFVYPLMSLHMQRAQLSIFNNFYTSIHDFTPKPDIKKSGSNNGNIHFIFQEDFEKICWLQWRLQLLDAKQQKPNVQDKNIENKIENKNNENQIIGDLSNNSTVSLHDITISLFENKEEEVNEEDLKNKIQNFLSSQSILSRLPLLLQTSLNNQKQKNDNNNEEEINLTQLPVNSTGLFEMFQQTVVIPFTLGTRKIPQIIFDTHWQPRLFAITTCDGGAAIATRIVRDIELLRRHAFINSMQEEEKEKKYLDVSSACVYGPVLLLNTIELCCTDALVRDYVAPAIRVNTSNSSIDTTENDKIINNALHRMKGHACIFILALLRPNMKGEGVCDEAQNIFMPPASLFSKVKGKAKNYEANNNHNNNEENNSNNDDDSNISSHNNNNNNRDSPSPRLPRYSGNVEDVAAWEKTVLLNISFSLQHLGALQLGLFQRASTSGIGIGSAFN